MLEQGAGVSIVVNVVARRGSSDIVHHFMSASPNIQAFIADERGKSSASLIQDWFILHTKDAEDQSDTSRPDGSKAFAPFDESVLTLAESLASQLLPPVSGLVSLVQDYQRLGPPHSDRGVFDINHSRMVNAPSFFPRQLPAEVDIYGWITSQLPESFSTVVDPEHPRSSPGYVLHWVASSPFLDINTGLQFGGPGGVRFGLFLVLRILNSLRLMQPNASFYQPKYGRLGLESIQMYAYQVTHLFAAQIGQSMRVLRETGQPRDNHGPPRVVVHSVHNDTGRLTSGTARQPSSSILDGHVGSKSPSQTLGNKTKENHPVHAAGPKARTRQKTPYELFMTAFNERLVAHKAAQKATGAPHAPQPEQENVGVSSTPIASSAV